MRKKTKSRSDIDAWVRTRACSAPKATADDLEGTIGLDCTGGLNSVDYVSRLRGDRTIEPGEPELGLPEEPKEAGYYITQQKRLLRKDPVGWYLPACGLLWKDGSVFTRDWSNVCETLGGVGAFPLIRLNTGKEPER